MKQNKFTNNREIKFRAWDKENNQWVNQNAVLPNWSDTPYFNVACIVGDETLELRSDENFIWCEYTGLKDKNGKEVFEGDVIRGKPYKNAHVTRKGEVFFVDGCFMVKMQGVRRKLYQLSNLCEVIGNVYQNPELLVDKKR